MSTTPSKRRKIRPGNAIALAKLEKKAQLNKNEAKKRKTDDTSSSNVSTTPASKIYSSASDSDETDDEKRTAQKKKALSASDSDDTDSDKRTPKKVVQRPKKTKSHINRSDSEDSDSDTQENTTFSKVKDRSHLSSNRISFRQKTAYNEKLSPANNLKNRLNDLFVPEVSEDYFISDSDSETDSGEDYESKEYPTWQRNLSAAHNKEKDPWPKQRKFGYSDKLKLEKRVKKICRREGITFDQVREIFSSNQRGEYTRLFQKIVKVFPDMSLHRLAKLCKEMYHQKRNAGPWTEQEIKALEELIKIHGSNPTLLSEHLNRSPKNISDFLYSHQNTSNKSTKRWTKEEDELIAKEAAKVLKKDGKISFDTIVPLFKGTRTQRQIHTRYRSLSNRIQPDGTLAEKRKATLYEELRYLKGLLAQVRQHRLVEESQVDFVKNRGFVDQKFYLKSRSGVKGFETMGIKEILHKLIEKQSIIIDSRKKEGLLESEPEA